MSCFEGSVPRDVLRGVGSRVRRRRGPLRSARSGEAKETVLHVQDIRNPVGPGRGRASFRVSQGQGAPEQARQDERAVEIAPGEAPGAQEEAPEPFEGEAAHPGRGTALRPGDELLPGEAWISNVA